MNPQTQSDKTLSEAKHKALLPLTLGALGIVYGDIGTSPLYALRECFHHDHALILNELNVLGILSLIIWSLIFVVSIKYLIFVLSADNRGEGGVLALMALIVPHDKSNLKMPQSIIFAFGLFGAALLYGDGVITPAISVLSAIEGIEVATPNFKSFIIPLTVVILIALFLSQKRGTGSIGKVFGPIILLWFFVLALLGIAGMMENLSVLKALNPIWGFEFLLDEGWKAFSILGAVFLVVTGTEALYADMGHFGKEPIRLGWFLVALPCLILNYLGQGAVLLTNSEARENPFYALAPSWGVIPLVCLATAATVIASQALISGSFSLTSQAVQLGYLPRMDILHTSSTERGQIYIPLVNGILLALTLSLVLVFKSSSNLAAAYGLSVSLTMVITTTLLYFAGIEIFKWNKLKAVILCLLFLAVDLAFFGANLLKFFDGGYFPFILALMIFILMQTWLQGRRLLSERLQMQAVPIDKFLSEKIHECSLRVPGVAIFMSREIDRAPTALIHNLKHNKVLHEIVILLQVITEERPYVSQEHRVAFTPLHSGFYNGTLRYGFMEMPDVPADLSLFALRGLRQKTKSDFPFSKLAQGITYFLGRETVLPTNKPLVEKYSIVMPHWQEKLFSFITKLASRATTFYHLPPEQVIEIGSQVEI